VPVFLLLLGFWGRGGRVKQSLGSVGFSLEAYTVKFSFPSRILYILF
jgi:hypothetical protein